MYRILISLFLIILAPIAFSQNIAYQWIKQIGGVNNDNALDVKIDAMNNVFVVGVFKGTVDFDPGIAVSNLTSVSNQDAFVAKYDSVGNLLWAKNFGYALCRHVIIDKSGNIILNGFFTGTVDLDPGAGQTLVTSNGNSDFFISKFTTSGNFIWGKGGGGTGVDDATSLDVDELNNVYATGQFYSTVDFDMGIGVYNLTAVAGGNTYILKMDSLGNFTWVKLFTGVSAGRVLKLDKQNQIYTMGEFAGNIDFDPGPNTYNLNGALGGDIFISKLDSSGSFIWAKKFGGNGEEYIEDFTIDANDNLILGGIFVATTDLNPDPVLTFNLTATQPPIGSNYDAFISCLDSNGLFIWGKQISSSNGSESIVRIITDSNQHIYLSGAFSDAVNFDPGFSNITLNDNGLQDIFILHLTSNGNFAGVTQIGNAGSENAIITFDNSGVMYMVGLFSSVCDFDPGVNVNNITSNGLTDAFIGKFTFCNTNSSTLNEVSCNSFFFNNQTLTSSGIYTDTMVNFSGCDSIITLNLTINASGSTQSQTACDFYSFNGQILTQSGTYYDTLTNALGCDSIITLNLTINVTVASISQVGAVLTATPAAANYQWLNCPSFSPIANAISQIYTATANGEYACIVTLNNCIDTSDCVVVSGLDLLDNFQNKHISISPNPSSNSFTISHSDKSLLHDVTYKLTNLSGQIISQGENKNCEEIRIDISTCGKGIYFLELKHGSKISQHKIVKE